MSRLLTDNSKLSKAIERLYEAFSLHHLPPNTEHCLCCVSDEDDGRIHSKPLRDLSSEDLKRYAFKAISTWGDSKLFRHFLPRIYELMLLPFEAGGFAIEPAILLKKLRMGDWLNWPESEREAVRSFLWAYWESHLANPFPFRLEDWEELSDQRLCAIASAEPDLKHYLDCWLLDESPSANRALALFLLRSSITLDAAHRRDAFWTNSETQYAELREWIRTPEVQEKLRRASADKSCGTYSRECADAADLVLR